mmetsp:Transcript_10164/g.30501  ORF Transcript_10164/g.30501 Transcript_10164/m.30501 type:complete len:269 (-) Transcript_10164:893-1699(-)
MTVRYWRSATGLLFAGAHRKILHCRPRALQAAPMRAVERSQAGNSQSATKSYQWQTPSGLRSGNSARRKSATRVSSSSSVAPFGRGASSLWKEPCRRPAATEATSPSRSRTRPALSGLCRAMSSKLRPAHFTALGLSSTATMDAAGVLSAICRASGQQPAKATRTSSPSRTWPQMRWRSGPMRGLKKTASRSTMYRTPNSLCVVMSGRRSGPARISTEPGLRRSPWRPPQRAAAMRILRFSASRAAPTSSRSASGGGAERRTTSPMTS